MSEILYGRKCKILIADKNNDAWDVASLKCVFRIEKSVFPSVNFCEVKIYNINTETDISIIKEGVRIVVEAGYDGYVQTDETRNGETVKVQSPKQYGKIFDGQIVQYLHDREENIDYTLTLIAYDGDAYLNRSFTSFSVNKGINQRQIIDNLTTKVTSPIDVGHISPNLSTKTLPRGKVFFGAPKGYLRDVARDNNANLWVDDGQVIIAKITDLPPGEALVLSPKTGLVGVPQQTQDGIQYRSLLNPSIILRSMVKIDNSIVRLMKLQAAQNSQGLLMFSLQAPLDADGQYQTAKIIHIGDTRGNEWYTDVVGISSYGKGLLPMLLQNAAQNPNR